MGKTNKYNKQEDETLPENIKKYKRIFLSSFLKNSPNRLFPRFSLFSSFSPSPY